MSCWSCLSAKDNEMKPEAVHRSPSINLTAEENAGKPQLGYCLIKVVQLSPQMGYKREETRKS